MGFPVSSGLPYQVSAVDGHPGGDVGSCVGEHRLTLSDVEGPELQIRGIGPRFGVDVPFQQQDTGSAGGPVWLVRRSADGVLVADREMAI